MQSSLNHVCRTFSMAVSSYRGGEVKVLLPQSPGSPSALELTSRDWDILLTAETHNFPCAVAPYPGAVSCSAKAILLARNLCEKGRPSPSQ